MPNQLFCFFSKRAIAPIVLTLLMVSTLVPTRTHAESIELPTIGEAGLGAMSPNEEEVLGQAWLKAFRSSVRLYDDPIVYEYVENLLYTLASQSEIGDKSLDLIVVDNSVLNAFAVPGGVIGVHTGLLDAAENEAQLASVLSHELAHLFQRHFARSTDAAKRANLVSILGALAGVAIAASGGGSDAATAAIVAGQAAAVDNQLRYSRAHEREADRLGMQNMVSAGYSAQGAAQMFQVMQNASRLYGQEIPEFLLTHPITQSRISDARLRARNIAREHEKENRPLPKKLDSTDFQLIKARLAVINSATAENAAKTFKHRLKQESANGAEPSDATRYGLAMALLENNQFKEARTALSPLLSQVPGRILYSLLDIEIDIQAGNTQTAERRLRDLYALNPKNYSIGMRLSELLLQLEKSNDAASVLYNLTRRWPNKSSIWYHLAEAQGKAGDILGLHQSRAEFFFLTGRYNEASLQLQQAARYARDNVKTIASIRQRTREMQSIIDREKALGIDLG